MYALYNTGIKINTRAVVGGYSLLLREHTPNDTGIKNNTRTWRKFRIWWRDMRSVQGSYNFTSISLLARLCR